MKNTLNKIKINSFTYYFLITCFICGFIKNTIILFFIVIIHEIGHLIMIKICCYKIERINIYPFGGITTINKLINSNLNKDLIISLNGIIFQNIVIFLITTVFNFNENTVAIINSYNKSITIFNILPIIPLDGSKIIENIFNRIFSYKISYYLTIFLSFISIVIFFEYNKIYSINNYLIISVLLFYTFKYLKDLKYTFNKFLLERIMYNLPFKKIDNNSKKLTDLKINNKHYFKTNDKYISETEKIRKKFDKSTYFWYDFNVWKGFLFKPHLTG